MEIKEQVLNIINKLKFNKPAQAFKKISDFNSGMGFVLLSLAEAERIVYASTISEEMGISRARVGILLQKMESKGYIKKAPSSSDARIEVIKITQEGIKKHNEIIKSITKLINEFGYEKLNNFLDMACKIRKIIEEGDLQ